MITMKKFYKKDLDELIIDREMKDILNKQLCHKNKEYFGVLDDTTLLGYGSITLFPNISTSRIHEIYILPHERNKGLGDGLLRAILNYGRINLCTWAIIKCEQDLNDFLVNRGMRRISYNNLPAETKDIFEQNCVDNLYICNIDDFFSRQCGGCK